MLSHTSDGCHTDILIPSGYVLKDVFKGYTIEVILNFSHTFILSQSQLYCGGLQYAGGWQPWEERKNLCHFRGSNTGVPFFYSEEKNLTLDQILQEGRFKAVYMAKQRPDIMDMKIVFNPEGRSELVIYFYFCYILFKSM